MTFTTSVVHISPTPLVAAPAKISSALRNCGFSSIAVALEDYPEKGPLYQKFSDGIFVYKNASSDALSYIHQSIQAADIVHIHNDLPSSFAQKLLALAPNAHYVYQVHSPLKEGPNYIETADYLGSPFQKYLCVSQYHPRIYGEYIPVPNLILEPPSISLRKAGEKLRVMFSPTHSRTGRWNAKYSAGLENALESLRNIGKIELIKPETALSPGNLMSLRRTAHVSIDEIATGAFHQVSLEAMCAGNAVINGADYFSKAMLAQYALANEMPPFIHANEKNIADILLDLSFSVEKTNEYQNASFKYFTENISPAQMIKPFLKIYETLL